MPPLFQRRKNEREKFTNFRLDRHVSVGHYVCFLHPADNGQPRRQQNAFYPASSRSDKLHDIDDEEVISIEDLNAPNKPNKDKEEEQPKKKGFFNRIFGN